MANTYQNIDLTQLFDNSVNQDAIKDVYTASKEIVDLIRNNYLNEGMSPQGKLANFNSVINYDGRLYQLQLMLPKEWYWVEFGRNPGPVSIEGQKSILEWVKTSIRIGKLVPRGSISELPEDKRNKSLAFLISRKIKRYGFYSPNHQGKHVIEKSLNEADPLVEKLCSIITEKMNAQVHKEIVSVFEDLKTFSK